MSDAILMLGGLGMTRHRREVARQFYSTFGWKVVIPDYFSYRSLDRCIQNVADVMDELEQVDRLHVFCNVLGGWVFNLMLRSRPLPNLTSVIYDRSPTQELAAKMILDIIPFSRFFARWIFPLAVEFGDMPYPPLPRDHVRVGLLVENKATWLMHILKKLHMDFSSLGYAPENFNQPHDDIVYLWLDHDEIYTRYDITGSEIQHFFQTGCFTADARRRPFDRSPFA